MESGGKTVGLGAPRHEPLNSIGVLRPASNRILIVAPSPASSTLKSNVSVPNSFDDLKCQSKATTSRLVFRIEQLRILAGREIVNGSRISFSRIARLPLFQKLIFASDIPFFPTSNAAHWMTKPAA